jgi:3-oxoacyl-[acyl-carrier protein] reductase
MTAGTRTALITGSGRNIGRAIALHLARSGFNVVVNGSRDRAACEAVAGEVRAAGPEALAAMGDVGDRAGAAEIAREAIARFGTIDVLVNNAAVRPSHAFLEVSEEDWHRVIDVNFNAARWLVRACLPGMIERGWGRIVNFTGMHAQQGYPGKCHVTVSKHAAWGLTKSLAKEFGPKGITANIISPGTIVGEDAESHSMAGRLDSLRESNPSGRLGLPDDIAAMVDLLVSDRGGFVNGQLLQVNGGVVT